MFLVAVAQSSSDNSAVCYLLPVLWMTSCFHMDRVIISKSGSATVAPLLVIFVNDCGWGKVCYPRLPCLWICDVIPWSRTYRMLKRLWVAELMCHTEL